MVEMENPAFLMKTLGCKVNQYESQAISESFLSSGYRRADGGKKADVCVINICTVTHRADLESAQIIRRCAKENPDAKIIVTGCFDKEDKRRLLGLNRVDSVISNKDKGKIVDMLHNTIRPGARQLSISGFDGHDRAFVMVQTGCENFCSYCKVALIRGKLSSKKPDLILDEINRLLDNGFKEIVLTGICLGAYGKDIAGSITLTGLLEQIVSIDKDFRVRLSSIEPRYVTDSLILLMKKSDKICGHLHIPLQSGDDKILRLMNRRYKAQEYLDLIQEIRKQMADIAITTDVLVGFPGESDKNFNNTLKLIKKIRPSRMHVFGYSPRPGTKAYNFQNAVDKKTISERVKKISELANRFSLAYRNKFIGKKCRVLVESKKDNGKLSGYTDNYIRVSFKGQDRLIGKFTRRKLY